MQIIMSCWTPECYDVVSHAVLDIDLKLVYGLLEKLDLANKLKLSDSDFMGLEYDDYSPNFVSLGNGEKIGISDEDFEDLTTDGWEILPELDPDFLWDEIGMRPCMLMVMAGDDLGGGRIYWYGCDKHCDASCRAETYSFERKELIDIKAKLEETR